MDTSDTLVQQEVVSRQERVYWAGQGVCCPWEKGGAFGNGKVLLVWKRWGEGRGVEVGGDLLVQMEGWPRLSCQKRKEKIALLSLVKEKLTVTLSIPLA